MAFSARTVSREMEVQMGKAPPCLNPFPMVIPFFPTWYVSPSSSMSAPVFQSGMRNGHGALDVHVGREEGKRVIDVEYLFSKILTPSDVGKLNRLLIPRQCAEECFPKISELRTGGDDEFLNFQDSTGLIWRFRFCLWNNRKSYVLTTGWQVFIKEKNLKKGDVLSFYRGKSTSTNHMFIHIKPHTGTLSQPHQVPSPIFFPYGLMVDYQFHESLGFGTSQGIVPVSKLLSFGSGEPMPPTNLIPHGATFPESESPDLVRAKKRLRLFGVDIDIPSHECGDEPCTRFTENAASII